MEIGETPGTFFKIFVELETFSLKFIESQTAGIIWCCKCRYVSKAIEILPKYRCTNLFEKLFKEMQLL